MLTPRQIAWAAEHDWFVQDNGDGTITVNEDSFSYESDPGDGEFTRKVITWTGTFRELREWAGY